MEGILGTTTVTQIGIVVRDIEKTKVKYAEFFGVPVPPTCDSGDPAVVKTTYEGEPVPETGCYMAFYNLPNLQLELIQPFGGKSTWQDFLDQHGEGIHHIAFGVKGTDEKVLVCENLGFACTQRGKYGDGGGEYAYLDATQQLKCFIETLESY